MFMIKQIRKIPKAMLERIKAKDDEFIENPNGNTRFYRYYTLYGKELAEVVVAVRNHYKKWYCKQVVVHGIHNKDVYLRDICQTMGFRKVGWFRDGITKYPKWYDYNWGYNDDKYFYINAPIINKEFILTLPQYKYSALNLYYHNDIFKYLRLYEQYPQAELLVKFGLSQYATSKQILRKCEKDKQFCKWLFKNKNKLKKGYYTSSIVTAYNQNRPIEEVFKFDSFKKLFDKEYNFGHLKDVFKNDKKQLLEYFIKQNIDGYCYQDYLEACEYLGLDMSLPKNRYPHNFKHWHDIRIDQYHTAKAEKDKEERKELYEKFKQVANKYMFLERTLTKDDYLCIIALSPQQLIYEGEKLNHCVGRMNYDQKFVREESLIFFIRNKSAPNTPFVTMEYSIKNKKVLQCYAEHDSKPSDSVLDFVNNKWLPYANRKLNKILKAVA